MRIALDLMLSVFEKADAADGRDRSSGAPFRRLTEFVFEKVKFVITTVPRETDLNKLPEVDQQPRRTAATP